MATSKSPLGENRPPKPRNQGSSTGAHTKKPATSGRPGGFGKAPGSLSQPKRTGVRVPPKGGSGNGPGKGNKLPR